MAKHTEKDSEQWRTQNWKKIQRQVFRLQRKIYKASKRATWLKPDAFKSY